MTRSTPSTIIVWRERVGPLHGMTGIAMSGDEQRRQRRKRNLLLFGVHLLLALAILGWFVWSVAAK